MTAAVVFLFAAWVTLTVRASEWRAVAGWVRAFGRQRAASRAVRLTQWADALVFLAASLSAGLTLRRALEALSAAAPQPLRSEVRRSARSGNPAALFEGAGPEPGLMLARAAIEAAFEGGGNLGDVLHAAARAVRAQVDVEERLRTLTLQGRTSARVIALCPAALLALLFLTAPDYVRPLFTTLPGRAVLLLCALLLAAGLFLVERLSRPEES